MRRTLLIITIIIVVISFGLNRKKTTPKTLDQLHHEFVDVMLDSTASWKQVTDVANPFVDSLCAAAADESSLKNRMFGQEWGYMTIELMSEKYDELNEAGKDVNYDDLSNILDTLADGLMVWFYSPDEQLPHVWRDHYYVCHQQADEPTNGFFHLMVTIPTDEMSEPSLRIFYPDAAESSPIIIFTKYKGNGSTEEDEDSRDLVRLENWSPKDSVEDGYPMYAIGDASVVDKMLHNDVAYLLFFSGTSVNGDPGGTEIARLSLGSFQEQWNKVVH